MLLERKHLRTLTARTFGASQWLLARERRWILYLAAGLAGVGTFLELSEDLVEDNDLLAMDTNILRHVAALRRPFITIHAVDLTALGSVTLLLLVSFVAGVALLRMRDYRGAAQLICAMGGVAVWTYVTKNLFSRARPDLVYRLLDVQGYSFPSGHSSGSAALYLTIALVFAPHLHHMSTRILLFAGCATMALSIGLSRIYLGVHYASDVASGLTFGSGWAFLVAALFAWQTALPADPSGPSGELDNLERE
ncbi:MAG: Membrane-associated phospholipid phosphatase [Myxococcaceae bacterium]|nr:Membrane-associated phospholipid phosphatase [Myxococcaceae bacterium]